MNAAKSFCSIPSETDRRNSYNIFPGHIAPGVPVTPGQSWSTRADSLQKAAEWYFSQAGCCNKDNEKCTVVGPSGVSKHSFPTIEFFANRPAVVKVSG